MRCEAERCWELVCSEEDERVGTGRDQEQHARTRARTQKRVYSSSLVSTHAPCHCAKPVAC
jgi:hypothetical protein